MNEQKKCSSELPIRAESETLADPTCEEGGGAKLREAAGANAGLPMICKIDTADFCTTDKKVGLLARDYSPHRSWPKSSH
jgi:hypothetical protein